MTEQNKELTQALLHAAGTLFAETGYGQTDVESIAREADIDPAFIYSRICRRLLRYPGPRHRLEPRRSRTPRPPAVSPLLRRDHRS
ncbi:MAG: TetR family transcriptional regulator [Verrucomicrobia bacterium]|nr:TetR family transcriptional regulator [Verrucomicrobiota bacterium]